MGRCRYAATLSSSVWERTLLEMMGLRLPPSTQSSRRLEMAEQKPGPACLCLPLAVCSHHARVWVALLSFQGLAGSRWPAERDPVPMAVPVLSLLFSSFLLNVSGLSSLLIRMQLPDSSALLEKAVRHNKGGLVFAKTSSIELSTSSRG